MVKGPDQIGGLTAMKKRNEEKAKILYDFWNQYNASGTGVKRPIFNERSICNRRQRSGCQVHA